MRLIFLFLSFISFGQTGLCVNLSSSVDASSFQILDVLGKGLDAFVFKVRLRSTNQIYAMKVPVRGDKIGATYFPQTELNFLQRLNTTRDPEQHNVLALLSSEIQQPVVFDFQASLLPDRREQDVSLFRKLRIYFMQPKTFNLKNHILCAQLFSQREPREALVFPFYEGGDLRMLLNQVKQRKRKLTDSDIIELTIGIVRALQALRIIGYVHNDLHPGNILLDSSHPIPGSNIGRPVLTDFGLTVKDGSKAGSDKDVRFLGLVFLQLVFRCNLDGKSREYLRRHFPEPAPEDVISRCWSCHIEKIPSLDAIMTHLEELREKGLSGTAFFELRRRALEAKRQIR